MLKYELCDQDSGLTGLPVLTIHVGEELETRDDQPHQEPCAWLVEIEVFRLLGLLDRLGCWKTCVDEASVQEGVTAGLMWLTRERWGDECKKHGRAIAMMITGDASLGSPGDADEKESGLLKTSELQQRFASLRDC